MQESKSCSFAALVIKNVPGEELSDSANAQAGPSCSKLTTSLVNDSLKFTLSNTQIC